MELIDKAAVVAEIEKQIELGKIKCQQSQENNYREGYIAWSEHIATCGKILTFINTLEVKEVDLNEEIERCLKQHSMLAVGKKDFTDIARHFFELGLKTQKDLTT